MFKKNLSSLLSHMTIQFNWIFIIKILKNKYFVKLFLLFDKDKVNDNLISFKRHERD